MVLHQRGRRGFSFTYERGRGEERSPKAQSLLRCYCPSTLSAPAPRQREFGVERRLGKSVCFMWSKHRLMKLFDVLYDLIHVFISQTARVLLDWTQELPGPASLFPAVASQVLSVTVLARPQLPCPPLV